MPTLAICPSLSFVMLGVNDEGQSVTPSQYIANLKQIKLLLGGDVTFITPTPFTSGYVDKNAVITAYSNAIKTEFPGRYVDLTEVTFQQGDYCADGVHLLDGGHIKIAAKVMDFINAHYEISQ